METRKYNLATTLLPNNVWHKKTLSGKSALALKLIVLNSSSEVEQNTYTLTLYNIKK